MPTPDSLPDMDDTDELLTIDAGAALMAELTRGSQVPVSTESLTLLHGMWEKGCILVGDVPLRPVKLRGRWRISSAQIRQAADAVQAIRLDRRNLVPIAPPAPVLPPAPRRRRTPPPPTPPVPDPGTWRAKILSRLERWPTPRDAWVSDATDTEVQMADRWTVGSTMYLHLVVPHGGRWCIPRAYAELLDRWQDQNERAREEARRCTRCGQLGPAGRHTPVVWEWRETRLGGYVTTCPDCVAAETRPYAEELHGVLYAGRRFNKASVELWRCLICDRRAMYFDHCHDHGYVRGPLCSRCNTLESAAGDRTTSPRSEVVDALINDPPKWLRHLRRCVGCQEAGTLPLAHVARLGARLAVERSEPRHGSCRWEPYHLLPARREVESELRAGLPLRITFRCPTDGETWETAVPFAEVMELVREHIAAAVSDPGA